MSEFQSNRNLIIAITLISLVLLVFGIMNFHKAMPEVSIDFKISRQQALDTARDYLIGRGFNVDGYKEAITFTASGKFYLEKELGVEKMIELAEDSIEVWYWSARFFKPLEKLEYSVRVSPEGKITGFKRQVLESDPGLKIETEAAQILAETFLEGPIGENPDDWELVESQKYDRPNRTDHEFEYERRNFKAAKAPYRLYIKLQGAEVSSFGNYLKVPEEWERGYSKQRSKNQLLETIAMFFAFLLIIGAFVHLFKNVKSIQIPWKTVLWLGGALGIANFIMGLNSIPLSLQYYDTTTAFSAFIVGSIVQSFFTGLLMAALLVLLLGAGEYLYRQDNPRKLFIPNLFTRRGFQTREFLQATYVGYLMTGFAVGFVVLYYMVGEKFGFWSPSSVKYDDAVSTALPWIYPLATSMGASLLEEFMFRLFGVYFIKRIFKSNWLAIIIPAIIWAFLHSSYAQEPSYARGIELTIVGSIAGYIMLRFGIWATLTYHFVYDAILIGLFLFQSSNAYFWISGLIVCGGLAIPAIIAVIAYLRNRSFDTGEDLLNISYKHPPRRIPISSIKESTSIEPATESRSLAYIPLNPKVRISALIIGAIGLILVLAIPGPRQFGDDFIPEYDRSQAIKYAKEALQQRYGKNPDDYKIVAISSDWSNGKYNIKEASLSYTKKYGSIQDAEEIFLTPRGASGYKRWIVGFKRELDPEKFYFHIPLPSGEVYSWHILADTTSGANLAQDSALVIATAVFQQTESHADTYQLIQKNSEKKDNRTDHNFTWESIDPVLAESHFRRNVNILGDEANIGLRFLKVPEEWERFEDEHNIRSILSAVLLYGLVLVLLVYSLFIFGKKLVHKEVSWKSGILFGVVVAVLAAISSMNEWATVWWDYYEAQPAGEFITGEIIQNIITVIASGLLMLLSVNLAESLAKERYGISPWSGGFGTSKRSRQDLLFIVFGMIGALAGLKWIIAALTGWGNLPVHTFSLTFPRYFSFYSPVLAEITEAASIAIKFGAFLTIAFVMFETAIKRSWLRIIILVLLSIGIAGTQADKIGNLTTGEFVWLAVQYSIFAITACVIFKNWIAGRIWMFMTAWFTLNIYRAAFQYLGWGDSPYKSDGYVLLCVAVVVSISLIVSGFVGGKEEKQENPLR